MVLSEIVKPGISWSQRLVEYAGKIWLRERTIVRPVASGLERGDSYVRAADTLYSRHFRFSLHYLVTTMEPYSPLHEQATYHYS
jgi:hypothetical protein